MALICNQSSYIPTAPCGEDTQSIVSNLPFITHTRTYRHCYKPQETEESAGSAEVAASGWGGKPSFANVSTFFSSRLALLKLI